MARRSRAREVAFQVIYQLDLNPGDNRAAENGLIEQRLNSPGLIEFARSLVDGVQSRWDELDRRIDATAANWSITRMAATDRNVLRLGAYEVLYADTPNRVAVDEAIELAKRFGAAESPQFVNGILDRLMNE